MAETYHFYGDLYLEDPEKHLPKDELNKLRSFEPLLEAFRKQSTRSVTPSHLPRPFRRLTAMKS